MQKLILLLMLITTPLFAIADNMFAGLKEDMAYKEARVLLIAQGWQPIQNQRISNVSLYAQEIYDEGLIEVVDCISMELDACRFQFSKHHKVLELKTITRELKLDTFKLIK
jgi:hypothetical protein